MSGIDLALFDIGGVLVNEIEKRWVKRWEQRLDLASGSLEPLVLPIWEAGSVGAIDLAEVHRRLKPIVGDTESFMEDVWTAYLGTPREELLALFQRLPLRKALLSNSFVGAREREARRYGFDRMCERIVYSHEVGLQKPHPRIYTLTCELLGLAPEQVLFADDRQENCDAARALGMTAVRVGADESAAVEAIEASCSPSASSTNP